jgi:transcriptional regulator of aromatic amino acid metabolism
VPPLRERLSDLPAVCQAVLQRIAGDAGVNPVPTLAPEAMQQLLRYNFPATCVSWKTCCTGRLRWPAPQSSKGPTLACR